MLRKAMAAVITTLLASTSVLAQTTGRISGVVTAADGGTPIAGVQIAVIGTTGGTVTREDGRYFLNVAPGTYTVRAARIGFAPDSMPNVVVVAGGSATADFKLRTSAIQLTAVEVYGQNVARDRTGVVESVDSASFNKGTVVSAEQLIQAKVAGVQVVDNNEPGGGLAVRVRGATSINSSNEPLFVVDGIPLAVSDCGCSTGRNAMNFLNPNDIASVSVLKDASATAIYGSRGANGVILVTTKTGRGAPQFTYDVKTSVSSVDRNAELMNAAQLRTAVTTYAPTWVDSLKNANTDWIGAVEQSGYSQEHNVGMAGSRDQMMYRLSLGYLDQTGVLRGTELKRLSLGLNYADRMLNNRLALRANIRGSRTDDRFTPGAVIGEALTMAPTQPILNTNGTYYQWSNYFGINNPIQELNLMQDRGHTLRTIGGIEGEYQLPWITGLATTVRVSADLSTSDRTQFSPTNLQSQVESANPGRLERNSPNGTHTVFDWFGTYNRSLSLGDLSVTGGYSYETERTQTAWFYAAGLSTNFLGPNGVPSAKETRPSLYVDESLLASFFARANWSMMNDRYVATFTVRRDGSSKFGPQNQWGTFPSFGLAWRPMEESFFPKVGFLSDLKLRGSWGVNGNQAFANYKSLSVYEAGGAQVQVQMGNEWVSTIRPSAADPNIKWEETTSWDVGADYGLWANRIAGALDFYKKSTADLIFTVPVAGGANLSNYVTTNIGSSQNTGYELSLNAAILDGSRGGLTWNAMFNAAHNSNKLTQINPRALSIADNSILTGGISGGVGNNIQILRPGYALNSFFVYKTRYGADGNPVSTGPDTAMFVDLNGDHQINQADRRPFKSPDPKWILGHTSSFGWREFDAGFTLRAYLGNYVYNNVSSSHGYYNILTEAAGPVNMSTSVLKTKYTGAQFFSDYYLEDASFLRLDNITLGYTFHHLSSADQLRVYLTGQNLMTLTGYSGVDPTAGVNGIDNNIYPRARTFSAGASIVF